MINLQIISGTDRPGSNALRISKFLQRQYAQLEAEAQVLDLQQFPLEKVMGGKYREELPEVARFVKPAVSADGLVLVIPEYNGSFPGILKLFIDYLPFPETLDKKPVALVGEANGSFGALRAVEHLQQVCNYRNAHVFPERVFIPRVKDNFDEQKGIENEFQQELLESQIKNFVPFVQDFSKKVEA